MNGKHGRLQLVMTILKFLNEHGVLLVGQKLVVEHIAADADQPQQPVGPDGVPVMLLARYLQVKLLSLFRQGYYTFLSLPL